MIIGIDETGDFKIGSEKKSFFIAVLLQQHKNRLEIKREQYKSWLDSISKDKINSKNEIKGSELNEDELLSFAQMVYCKEPAVIHKGMYIIPSDISEELMKEFKEVEVNSLKELVILSRKEGKIKMSEQYEKMRIWYQNSKKMHYPHYLKLLLLRKLINETFRIAVGTSICLEMLDDIESENLLNLEFKIDSDFIRAREPNLYWKELLRNEFNNENGRIPVLDSWDRTKHPFLKKYGKGEGKLSFKSLFTEKCNFMDSHDNFEIQIADIIGIIFNRYHNRGLAKEAYEMITCQIQKENLIKIELNFNISKST